MRSAVAGSERLKRRVYEATGLQEVFNDNNKHISLKSSPDKTVPALSPLAEKEGIVVKLNDTGSWRRRHALLVPHTFLYYFGENTAATDLRPHGVIDLELYTDIKVVDGNVVRLAPEDDNSPIRTFYLRLPSKEEAEGWADTIRGTRFVSVREERDALRSAKTVLTEQIAILVETLKESRDSLEASHRRETAAVSELAHSNAKEARCAALVRALAASACDAGEERRWSEARAEARAGQRWGSDRHLVDHIEAKPGGVTLGPAVCALSELAALEEAVSERVREVAALKRANETLRESASAEAEHRREQEAAALNLRCQEHERVAGEAAAREEVEAEVQALRVELEATRAGREEARANLGVVAAACREAEAKARELQEHRRVLAREVKASRAEQRRLSAALACATRAATAAAATAAAATAAMATASASASNATAANANAADANATAGNAPNVDGGDPSRSPSSAGSLAGDGARKVEVARGSRRIGGGGGEIEGVGGGGSDAETDVGDEAGGERYHGEGDDACVGSSPARDNGGTEAGQKNKTERAEVLGPTPTRDSVEPGDAESSSSSVDGTRGPVPAGVDDKGDILSSPSPQLRPPPLDLLRTPLRGSEGGVGGESGATSPEAGSPGLPEGGSGGSGSVSGGSCGSGGGGGSCGISGSSGRRRESEWNPLPSPSSDTQAISPVGRGSCGSVGAKTPGWSKVGVGGGGGDNGKEGHGREMTGRAEEVVAEDGALTVDRRSLCIATGVGESVGAGARRKLEDADRALPAGSPSEADLVGESSRFVNEMVQIFSDGLRESTRTRRTPLLGSLDAGSDADDATKEVEKEEGGDVTDGVDRDSRPFATPKEEEREEKEKEEGEYGAWSAWSTVVVSCDGPVAVAVKEESGARAREGAVCAESLSRSGGVGREEEGSRSGSSPDGQQQSPSKDTGDGTGSVAPTDSTDDHNPPAAAILMGPRATATITESELGAGDSLATSSPVATLAPAASTAIDRQDSLEAAANETAAAGVTQPLGSPADWLRKVGRPDQGWPPLHEESGCSPTPYPLPENGNSCRGSGDGNAAAAAAVAAATAAAAAAAAAAAERGGRVSSEAAAAARRWEAKLKGSLMSMTEGVRWGMGPQRLNGVPDANEH